MGFFVLEIDGRAAGVFQANDEHDAAAAIQDASFLPLTADASEIHVREATKQERAAWEAARISAIREGAIEPHEDSDWMVLLPVGSSHH
jgi:hypothetical protein